MFTYRSVAVAMYRYVVRLISLLALLTLASKKDSTFFFYFNQNSGLRRLVRIPPPQTTGTLVHFYLETIKFTVLYYVV